MDVCGGQVVDHVGRSVSWMGEMGGFRFVLPPEMGLRNTDRRRLVTVGELQGSLVSGAVSVVTTSTYR